MRQKWYEYIVYCIQNGIVNKLLENIVEKCFMKAIEEILSKRKGMNIWKVEVCLNDVYVFVEILTKMSVAWSIWKRKIVGCYRNNFMNWNTNMETENFDVKAMIQQ